MLTLASDPSHFMPGRHSTFGTDIDWLFGLLVWLTAFFVVLIGGLVIAFAVRYRRRPDRLEGEHTPTHHTALEMTWTVIPLIAVLAIFFWGFRGFMDMSVAPDDAYDIRVESRRWSWIFTYPSGARSDILYVPADRAVRLTLTSDDVIHSVFIPDFRIKRDAVPGRYNRTWFEARWLDDAAVRVADEVETEQNDQLRGTVHNLYCAEYCGDRHSRMLAKVVVLEVEDFRAKLTELAAIDLTGSPVEAGQQLARMQGCTGCHSTDGSVIQGPSFMDLYGSERTLADGTTRVADEEYIREQVLYPRRQTVAGFREVMPSFQGLLSDREVDAIIAFMQSISEHHDGEAGLTPAEEPEEPENAAP